MTFFETIEAILGNHSFVLFAIICSFLLKVLVGFFVVNQSANTQETKRLRLLLLAILGANMLSDITWIQELLGSMAVLEINPNIHIFIGRIAWGCVSVQYQGLALFIEGLITPQWKLTARQKLCCLIAVFFMIVPMGAAFVCFNHPEPIQFIFIINHIALAYYTLFLLPYTLFIVLQKIRIELLPYILIKQLRIICFLIIPHIISDFLQSFPFKLYDFNWVTNSYALISLTAIFLPIGLFYCARRVMGLRFLNLHDQVQAVPKADFIAHFRVILEQLDQVANTRELNLITQSFFKEAFGIPIKKITLYLRPIDVPYLPVQHSNTNETVETFLKKNESEANDVMKRMEVLVYDEINFSYFYDQSLQNKKLETFLTAINADIFLPIYDKDNLLAYVTVDRAARKELYNSAEHGQMVMFAGYLRKTICLLYKQSVEMLVEQNKQLTENQEILEKELHLRHQEMNQYKEGLQSFLHRDLNQVGLIFYKNNRFSFGNQAAKDFIPVNINRELGHPLVKKIRRVTGQVADFRSSQTIFSKDEKEQTITLTAIPHLEPDSVVIVVSHADIAGSLKEKINLLKDPNQWDYLLYLETTESGRLVNQLIPGNSRLFLDFKINLLQAALGKKPILLDIAQDDLVPTVELLHHISLREELQIFNLKGETNTVTMATKLFGINPLFGGESKELPLLVLLDQRGTLFIKDIHLLDLTCQEYLAEFMRYGSYRVYKSEQRKRSKVPIICSSNQDIARLVKENKFSKALFAELQHVSLTMPPLSSLAPAELATLVDGFSQQVVTNNAFKNLLTLTEKDKKRITQEQPASLQELKACVKQLLKQKAEKGNICQETTFSPAYDANDTELSSIARLGKHALKDKKIMTKLWVRFDKNQNKIAEFLGVNRSSVHRRCKYFNLT